MENTENEEFVQCPFDASHIILKKRLAVHLVRCKRQHKNTKLVQCPYNATHYMKKEQLEEHEKICSSRPPLESLSLDDEPAKKSESQPPMAPLSTTHDWSTDSEDSYNPAAYAASAPVVRMMQFGSKREKKKFRQEERVRLLQLEKEARRKEQQQESD